MEFTLYVHVHVAVMPVLFPLAVRLQALRQCRRIESDLGTYLPITVGCSATLTDTCKTGRSGTEVTAIS